MVQKMSKSQKPSRASFWILILSGVLYIMSKQSKNTKTGFGQSEKSNARVQGQCGEPSKKKDTLGLFAQPKGGNSRKGLRVPNQSSGFIIEWSGNPGRKGKHLPSLPQRKNFFFPKEKGLIPTKYQFFSSREMDILFLFCLGGVSPSPVNVFVFSLPQSMGKGGELYVKSLCFT